MQKHAPFGLFMYFTKVTNQIRLVRLCYFPPPSLTSIISGLRQNIKKLARKFHAMMRIIPAYFQLSSFKTVEEDRGDRQTDRHFLPTQALLKNLNSPPHSGDK